MCGDGHAFARVVVDLGDNRTECWGAGLAFVALSRATGPERLAVSGDLSATRIGQITKHSECKMVRRQDARLQSIHDIVKEQMPENERDDD